MKESVFSMDHIIIKAKTRLEQLIIYPIGDIHRETPLCDVARWKAFLKKAKKEIDEGHNVRFIGIGDWNDFAAWGDRKKIRNASLHESTVTELDNAALRHCTQLAGELEFTRGRWLGLIQGNHRWEFSLQPGMEGLSSDDYYAEYLGCKNLGDAGYVRVALHCTSTLRRKIDIVIYHGKAGGKLAGSTINQIEDLMRVFPGADLYICGHDHRKVAVPVSTLWAEKCKRHIELKQKRQWLVRSGSFLKGYVDGESSYIIRKMLAPTDLGIVKIKCGVSRNRKGTDDSLTNDIHVEY